MFLNKLFTYLTCAYLKNKRCFNVKSLTFYFHMKTKTLADFQICISLPLSAHLNHMFSLVNIFTGPTDSAGKVL